MYTNVPTLIDEKEFHERVSRALAYMKAFYSEDVFTRFFHEAKKIYMFIYMFGFKPKSFDMSDDYVKMVIIKGETELTFDFNLK